MNRICIPGKIRSTNGQFARKFFSDFFVQNDRKRRETRPRHSLDFHSVVTAAMNLFIAFSVLDSAFARSET